MQIIPIALLLWGLDDVARFRAGAAAAGRHNALVVDSVSSALDGGSTHIMNTWTVAHSPAALASSWYYILFQGAITGVVGAVILWRRVPTFSLHRNALVAITVFGLVAFWLYPVAPPRMLPGYHDVIAVTIPAFTSVVETNGAAQFASLPSLHIAWALWAAIALCTVVHKPLLRVLVWTYPFITAADVLATGNHYMLDIITAPGLVVLGYGVALTPAFVRRLQVRKLSRSAVWPSQVRPSQVRPSPMWHSPVWHSPVSHSPVSHSPERPSPMWHSPMWHSPVWHSPLLRYVSPQYISLYYVSLRNLLLPSLLLPNLLHDRETCPAWLGQSHALRQHERPRDPGLERQFARAADARRDHGHPPAQR